MAVRPAFDPNRDFVVAGRGITWKGQELKPGDPFPKDQATFFQLRTVYGSRQIEFAPPPEEPEDEQLDPRVTLTATGGGWYRIEAPWLDEPMKVQGKDDAEAEQRRLSDEGEPDYHHGVTTTEGENGWWEVKADWVDEPEKIHGEEAARERAAELREEGPPPPSDEQ